MNIMRSCDKKSLDETPVDEMEIPLASEVRILASNGLNRLRKRIAQNIYLAIEQEDRRAHISLSDKESKLVDKITTELTNKGYEVMYYGSVLIVEWQ
jgi:hypothetical protein